MHHFLVYMPLLEQNLLYPSILNDLHKEGNKTVISKSAFQMIGRIIADLRPMYFALPHQYNNYTNIPK